MSCCSCNRAPCVCVPQCPEDCPEIIDYDFENINLGGIGVLDGVSGTTAQFRGIRTTNSNIIVAHNAALNTVDLTVNASSLKSTATFSNAATRANAVPDFEGQLGVQLDTDVLYVATGTNAGDWAGSFVQIGKTVDTGAVQTTIRLLNAAPFTIDGGANIGVFKFSNLDQLVFDSVSDLQFINGTAILISATSTLELNGSVTVNDQFRIESTGRLNFINGSLIQIDSSTVSANAVLITSSTAGDLAEKALNTFLSTANTATYGAVGGTLSRVAYTSYAGQTVSNPPTQAEMQTLDTAVRDLSRTFAAVLSDMMNNLKPNL